MKRRPKKLDSRAAPAASPGSRKAAGLCVLLLALVGLAFWPSLQNGFVHYDDEAYVTTNSHVQSGLSWANVCWAFGSTMASNWHPLTWLSHMADCQFFALHAWGHHLTSLLFHAVNVLLLFLFLHKATGALWRSFMVAALFGIHPLRVESVAWVAERKDVLSTFFEMLALLLYVRYVNGKGANGTSPARAWGTTENALAGQTRGTPVRRGTANLQVRPWLPDNGRWYGVALVAFALALLSKPMVVALPCLLLLLDYWPLERFPSVSWRTLVLEKGPFFCLSAVSCVVTFVVQQAGGAVKTGLPFAARLENAAVACCRYLGKLFWPVNLSFFYPHPLSWPGPVVFGAAVLVLALSFFAVVQRQRRPYVFTGWFWFLGLLVPVLGFIQVGDVSLADHYTYVSAVGIFMALTWGVCALSRRWPGHRAALSTVAAAVLLLSLVCTRRQIGFWKDSETLFLHAIAVDERNFAAHTFLGSEFAARGSFDEAISHFQDALRWQPRYADAHNGLGIALCSTGLVDEGIRQFEDALQCDPTHAEAHNNLGLTLEARGLFEPAIFHLREAVRLKPDYGNAHCNLGLALNARGLFDEALPHFQQALNLHPGDSRARAGLEAALRRKPL